MCMFRGFIDLGAGLAVGISGLAAGFAIGIVGDSGVRGTAQQQKVHNSFLGSSTSQLYRLNEFC